MGSAGHLSCFECSLSPEKRRFTRFSIEHGLVGSVMWSCHFVQIKRGALGTGCFLRSTWVTSTVRLPKHAAGFLYMDSWLFSNCLPAGWSSGNKFNALLPSDVVSRCRSVDPHSRASLARFLLLWVLTSGSNSGLCTVRLCHKDVVCFLPEWCQSIEGFEPRWSAWEAHWAGAQRQLACKS